MNTTDLHICGFCYGIADDEIQINWV